MDGENGNQEHVSKRFALNFNIFQQGQQGYKETEPGTDNNLPVKVTVGSPWT